MNQQNKVPNIFDNTVREKLRALSDSKLLEVTRALAHEERHILAEVLQHLAEIQARKLFSPKYRSLYEYSRFELGYSEDQAARRISAMRLLRELPELESQVTSGALTLSVLGLAQSHFRNEKAFLAANPGNIAGHGLSREAKLETLLKLENKSARDSARILMDRSSAPEQLRAESVKPISSTMNELRIVVPDETLEKVSRLKGLLANKYPSLTLGQLVALMCDISLEKLCPDREGEGSVSNPSIDSPATSRAPLRRFPKPAVLESSGRVPAIRLRQAVLKRARNRCELCRSEYRLEIDHRIPFAKGGKTSIENLRVLCRNCNQRQAMIAFGYGKMLN